MADFRRFDLGNPLVVPLKYPRFGVFPTFFWLKMGQICVFGTSKPKKSDPRDPRIRKEVPARPQIGLENSGERFWCRRCVRIVDSWSIWGYFGRNPEVLEAFRAARAPVWGWDPPTVISVDPRLHLKQLLESHAGVKMNF